MLFTQKTNYVAVTIDAENISCTALDPQKSTCLVQAYARIPFSSACASSYIFNTTRLIQHVDTFLNRNRLKNSFLSFAISGLPALEKIITMPKATHNTEDVFAIEPEFKKLCWDSRYLYTTTDGQFAFYVIGMPRELIVQYKCMTVRAGWNMIMLTTSFAALLQAFMALQGKSHRQTELAACINQNNVFQDILNPQACARVLRVHPQLALNMNTEAPYLMNAFGLIRSGVIV